MKEIFLCENCGEEAEGSIYKEGNMEVERHYECPHCGFRRHLAYGSIMPDDSTYIGS